MFYSFCCIIDFQVNGGTVFPEKPTEEAEPATSPNSMQDYSPTVTGAYMDYKWSQQR